MEQVWEIDVSTNQAIGQINSYTGDWWNPLNPYPNYNYYSTTYTWPTTIYKYQITCPSCKKFNWLELDTIQECATKKCKAKLKAVSQVADHEIAVNE